jgi:hypothetical protein
MASASSYRVQSTLVATEIADRRALARSSVALTVTLAGVALIFLLEAHDNASSDAARFAVTITAAVGLLGAAALLWHEALQLSYLRSFHRLFLEPHLPAADLAELRHHPSTQRPGTAMRELPALGVLILAATIALALAWHSRGPEGTARDVFVYGTSALTATAALVVVFCELLTRWGTRLEQLARGISDMRDGKRAVVQVGNQDVLRLVGWEFLVLDSANLPRAELLAGAYFAPSVVKDGSERNDGWLAFKADTSNRVTPGASPESVVTPSLPARLGPSVAVVVGCAGLLFLVLSVVAGAPDKLPSWAFDSAAIYVAARAAVVALVFFLIANLLMNLASGRVLSSVGRSGLGFSGPSADELVSIDKQTSSALDDLRARDDALQSIAEKLVSDLHSLTQNVAEIEAPRRARQPGANP